RFASKIPLNPIGCGFEVYMEMTYMQISAELHLNKSTMAKRLRTALKRIKAEMTQEGIRDCPF
uniref:hypothetical protein n=1 Tax=Phocaeicola coprophilus TaxID=387090 RepID=UPI003079C8F8